MKKMMMNLFFLPKRRIQKTVMRMKMLAIVMLLAILQVSAGVRGQNAEISMNMQDANLVEFFAEVKKQTDYEFLYNHDLVMKKESIDLKVNNQNLQNILAGVLHERDLDYELEDDVIVILERVLPPKEIKEEKSKKLVGKVTDKDGFPLPGVSVIIKGTTYGTSTDVDGNYTLSLLEKANTLIFSYIGMLPKEIAYKGQLVLNVVLSENTEQMDEVVVTGYQTIKKGRATGSFQIINNEDLDNVASLDLTQKLQGIASGVKVNREGEILIRGKATLSAESKPLIVVDGFPWMGSLAEINTNDVEQITVLKDAASTSIYGVRGANGVVVITTKKGAKNSSLNINYINSFTLSEKPNLDDLDIMNSRQHIDLEWDSYEAAGFFTYGTYNYKSEIGEIYAAMQSGAIREEEAKSQVEEMKAYDNRSDIEELFFRREMTQKHTVSFDYGNEKNQFYASLSFDENKQKWKGTEGNNLSFTLNDNFKLNDLLALRLNMFGNYRVSKNNGQFASMTRPYIRFLDDNGNYLEEANGSFDRATRTYHEESLGLLSTSYNQVQEQKLKDKESKSNSIATNVSFDITPFKGVKFSTSVGYNVMNSRTEDFRHKDTYWVRSYVNRFTEIGGNQVVPYGHILRYNDSYSENLTLRTQLSISKEINDFCFNLNAGLERNSFKTESSLNNTRYNYHPQRLTESVVDFKKMTQGFMNAAMGWTSEYLIPGNQIYEDRYLSSYFIGNVGYKGKYDLFGSWRLDKTNLFGQSSKYRDQPAWSIGAKWQLSEEEFFDVDVINRLGIKASYGLSGNVEKNTSPYLIANASTDYHTGEPSLSVANPENPLLGWEKSYTTNVGLDIAMFNSRVNASLEYYYKHTKDVLAPVNVDPTTGFGGSFWSSFSKNNGEIINKGIDINLLVNVLSKKNFRYDVALNFSYNYNRVQNLEKSALTKSEYITGSALEGKAVDYIYGYRNAGLDQEGEPQVFNRNGEKVSWKNMGSLTVDDGKFFGRKTPPYFGSLSNTFTWKNFTADVFITYDLGHYVAMNTYPSPIRNAPSNNIHKIYDQRWRVAGDERKTKVPKLDYTAYSSQDRIQATWNSDFNIDNADVIRLKSVNLSYDFTSLLQSKVIKSCRARLGIENLWHWTAADNDKIYDNRIGASGYATGLRNVRDFYFPEFKTFTFGLNITF